MSEPNGMRAEESKSRRDGVRAARAGHAAALRRAAAEPRMPSSFIELSEDAVHQNVRFLSRQIGSAQLASVVKGNAYGHGIETYVPVAERAGIRRFMVFSADEASRVLAAVERSSTVTIMGDLHVDDVEWAVAKGVEFFVFDLSRLDAALRAARRSKRAARVHLELETGLYRTGLTEPGIRGAVKRIRANPDALQAVGLCTHMAGAESFANYHRILGQLERFDALGDVVERAGLAGLPRHVACSAAAFNYPEQRRDLVRFGIAQYGFWPSEETRISFLRSNERRVRQSPLRRVMRWVSRIMNVKSVPRGGFVGYGNSFQAPDKMRVAAVPTGYYHGFARAQSNLGHVLVRGQRCSVIGTVNMNMLLCDVTHVPEARLRDEVVLIGRQGEQEIGVGAFGERTHHLNYEVLVRLPESLPRVVV